MGGSGKPNYGDVFSAVMQYRGNLLAVGGFSFFGGKDFGGGGNTENMAVAAILPGPPTRAVSSRRENYRGLP